MRVNLLLFSKYSFLRSSGLVFIFLSTLLRSLPAQHFPSNEELRELRGVGSPKLSPDGKKIIVEVQNSTADGGQYHLWLLQTNGGPYRQLTGTAGVATSERDASFIPGTDSVLYQTGSRLVRLNLSDGTSEELKLFSATKSDLPLDIDSYQLSPDGKTLALLITDATDGKLDEQNRKERRDVTRIPGEDSHNHLYLAEVAGSVARLVPSLIDIDSVTWSPKSDRLLVLSHSRPPEFGYSATAAVIDAHEPLHRTQLKNIPATTFRAEWLHSGQGLVLFAQSKMDTPIGTSDLYTFDLRSDRLKHLDAGVRDSTLSPRVLIVSEDDKTALVSITHGVGITLGKVNLERGTMDVLDFGKPVIADFMNDPRTGASVFIGSSSISPPSIYWKASSDAPISRPDQPPVAPSDWKFAQAETVHWRNAAFRLEGLLYKPSQAHPSQRVPLIVMAHGGPSGQFMDTYVPLIDLLVAQGWAVFCPNPRGSTGYGLAFEAANKADLGNGDYLDIMAGVDSLLGTQPIDPTRLAFIGHSYGGEMAAFVEGKTDRFKAVVSSAPISNEISEQGTSEDPFPDTWFTGKPWRNFSLAWKQSPLAYVAHAKTPVLLLQGQEDTLDPPGQAKEFYHALRTEGVPVELLLFPRETHSSLGRHFYGYPTREPWHGTMLRNAMVLFIRNQFDRVRP